MPRTSPRLSPRLCASPLLSTVGAGVLAFAGSVAQATAQDAPPADATTTPETRPTIVLESYVGQRPANASALMEPLLDELEARGFAARPAQVLRWIGGRAPRPGALDRDRTAAEITRPAALGYAAYTRGKFAEAEAILRHALEQVHRNPAVLALDTTNLNATFKILVGLALSQAKLGDSSGSEATMVELIRTFPGTPITRADYGPDAEQLYRAVLRAVGKQVQAIGRGELAIAVDNDQAVIFVDGQIRGLGKATLGDLIPGLYRVFVQVPATAGRQYELLVNANQRTSLHVDWDLDSSLWVAEPWVGFVFATEAERARQAGFAGKLVRRWSDGEMIVVVGAGQLQGKPAVTGTLYDLGGNVVRHAVVLVDGSAGASGASEAKLRSLARFLDDGIADDGVSEVEDAAPVAGRPAPARAPSRLVPGLLVSAGTAALVAGGVLVAIDQDPGTAPPVPYRNTAPAGIAVGALGVAAASMGLWLWAAHCGWSSAPMLGIGPSGGFVGWAGAL
jgi:hypothetical protein